MKIGGPKPPAKPPITPDGSPKVEREGPTFAERLGGPKQAGAASDPARSVAAGLEEIVAALHAGDLDGAGAAKELVQRVVAKRGADLAPELREQLRAALERALNDDPTLAAKLQRVGQAAGADR
jgi:hypothetical protein